MMSVMFTFRLHLTTLLPTILTGARVEAGESSSPAPTPKMRRLSPDILDEDDAKRR